MNDRDRRISEYYRLSPTLFTVLQSMMIVQGIGSDGVCKQSLSIVLSQQPGNGTPSLHLTFRGVRQFTFQQPEWSQMSIGHLEICAGTTIPGVNESYLVRDPDQECIVSFECDDFEAVLA